MSSSHSALPCASAGLKHPFAQSTGLLQVLEGQIDVEEEDQFWEDFPTTQDEFFDPPVPSRKGRARSIASSSLRLADHSQEDSASFAQNVSIAGWTSVGDKLGAYIVFDCAILTREGTTIHALRRYSAFLRLQQELSAIMPELKAALPAFPPKNSFARHRPAFLEKRRRRLQAWLAAVLLHPVLGGLPVVRDWVIE